MEICNIDAINAAKEKQDKAYKEYLAAKKEYSDARISNLDKLFKGKYVVIGYPSAVNKDFTPSKNQIHSEFIYMKILNIEAGPVSVYFEGPMFKYSKSDEYRDCRWFTFDGFYQHEDELCRINIVDDTFIEGRCYNIKTIPEEKFMEMFYFGHKNIAYQLITSL